MPSFRPAPVTTSQSLFFRYDSAEIRLCPLAIIYLKASQRAPASATSALPLLETHGSAGEDEHPNSARAPHVIVHLP